MDLNERCEEVKKEISLNTKRSESVRVRMTPITKERVKKTSILLNVSVNELINYILNKTLV